MNEESHIDPQLEARIVALVLGEASELETSQLKRLIEQRPELARLKLQFESVHALMRDVGTSEIVTEGDDWKLPADKRRALLAVIDGEAKEPSTNPAVVQLAQKRWMIGGSFLRSLTKIAAAFCVAGFFGLMAMSAFVNSQSKTASTAQRSSSSVDEWDLSGEAHWMEGAGTKIADEQLFARVDPAAITGLDTPHSPTSSLDAIRDSLAANPTLPTPYYLYDGLQYFGEPPASIAPADSVGVHDARVSDPQARELTENGGRPHLWTTDGYAGLDLPATPSPGGALPEGAAAVPNSSANFFRELGKVEDSLADREIQVGQSQPKEKLNRMMDRFGGRPGNAPDMADLALGSQTAESMDGLSLGKGLNENYFGATAGESQFGSWGSFGGGSGGFGGEGFGLAREAQDGEPKPEKSAQQNLSAWHETDPRLAANATDPVAAAMGGKSQQERTQDDLLAGVPDVDFDPISGSRQTTQDSFESAVPAFGGFDMKDAEREPISLPGSEDFAIPENRYSAQGLNFSKDATLQSESKEAFGDLSAETAGGDEGFYYESLAKGREEQPFTPEPRKKALAAGPDSGAAIEWQRPLAIEPAEQAGGERVEAKINIGDQLATAIGTIEQLTAENDLFGDVQVEFVEELDLVIVRGSKSDVQRTLEVVEEIKKASELLPPTEYEDIKGMKEDKFIDNLMTVDEAAIPFDDRQPLLYGDAKRWEELTESRAQSVKESEVANSRTRAAIIAGISDNNSESKRSKTAKKSVAPTGLNETIVADEAFSTFSLHVSDVSFKLAQAALARGEWPEAAKVRIEEFVNAFDYGDPLPSTSEKVSCRVEQSIHPFLQQRNLLRVSMRTAAAGRSNDTPLRITFLLDNSGSMERIDRQQTVRRAFALLAQQLKPIDQVTLISFARQPRLLADKVSGTDSQQLAQIIENLPSEGGTNLEAALRLAFEKAQEQRADDAQNRIVLLTDGAVNLGDADPESLSQMITTMRDAGIAFDAAGISAEGLNDEILEALTRKGDGRYYLLDSIDDADDGFARQIAGALRPSAKNVKVQIEFNPQRVGRYKLLGFEKHLLKPEDFRNDQVDAAEMAAAEAGVAVYQFEAMPDGQGDVGSVSVRFRDLSTGQMIENRWPIPYEADAPRPDQAAPSLRIAASAALFAAKLRGEPLGESVELNTLSDLISGLPDRDRNTQRVQQLQRMLEQARQIGGK